ncbi:MAG: AAA family ATPase [bacterium]
MKIKKLNIEGLFDRLNYSLCFPENETILLLGPNGSGKTTILKIIYAVAQRQWLFFQSLLFKKIYVEYYSGESVTIQKNKLSFDAKKKENSNTRSHTRYRDFEMDFQVNFEVISKKSKSSSGNIDFNQEKAKTAFSNSKLREDRVRIDYRAGVIYLFDRRLDEEFELYDYLKDSHDKDLIQLFKGNHISEVYCNFINTKRLEPKAVRGFSEDNEDDRWRIRYSSRRHSDLDREPSVNYWSNFILKQVQNKNGEYGKKSQELDRLFPEKIIELANKKKKPKEDEIKSRIGEIETKFKKLSQIGVFKADSIKDIRKNITETLKKEVLMVLEVYCSNTEEKLKSFDDISEKVKLLVEIINRKFLSKEISFDLNKGLICLDIEKTELDLNSLSSGEQHQLVLFSELIFGEDEGLVLIDEPELSLHVRWQNDFISDMEKILKSKQQLFIATHSPTIIGHRMSEGIDLGDFLK